MSRREETWIDPRLVTFDADNSNSMTKRQYRALVDAVRDTGGLTENIVVVDMRGASDWPHVDKPFLCVSGEHRTRAAIDAGIAEIPARLFTPEEWDVEQREIQGVRHNAIGGEFNPARFAKLVAKLSEKYGGREAARDVLKFTDKSKFDKLVDYALKNLPEEAAEKVREAKRAGRMENIDQLSGIVNQLYSTYGDTLPVNFMIIDYGGKEHVWVRLGDDARQALREVRGQLVREHKNVSDLFQRLLTHPDVAKIISELPHADKLERGQIFEAE